MILQKTAIDGVFLIILKRFDDNRGYFITTFHHDFLQKEIGINYQMKQLNQAFNKVKGTLRGMHFQKGPHAETKLVRCVQGAIYDVVLDLRPDSKQYGQWVAQELSSENDTLFFIPKGLAHGYQTLTDNAIVEYAVDEFYHPESSAGVRFDDQAFKIDWPTDSPILSERDRSWPLINSAAPGPT